MAQLCGLCYKVYIWYTGKVPLRLSAVGFLKYGFSYASTSDEQNLLYYYIVINCSETVAFFTINTPPPTRRNL